jgi:hypothetical protein
VGFHEAFWVVIGTAAPVLALAAVVSMNDIGAARTRIMADTDRSGRSIGANRPRLTPEALSVLRAEMMQRQRSCFPPLDRAASAQQINLVFQALGLANALISIGDQRNVTPPWIAIIVAVLGLAVLSAVALTVSNVEAASQEALTRAESSADLLNDPGPGPARRKR